MILLSRRRWNWPEVASQEESDVLAEEGERRAGRGQRPGELGRPGRRAQGERERGRAARRPGCSSPMRPGHQNPGHGHLRFRCPHCRSPARSSGYEPRGTAEAEVTSGPRAARRAPGRTQSPGLGRVGLWGLGGGSAFLPLYLRLDAKNKWKKTKQNPSPVVQTEPLLAGQVDLD